jgi:hypothetical protein
LKKTNNEIMAAKQQQRTSLTYFAWSLGIGYPMIEPLWNNDILTKNVKRKSVHFIDLTSFYQFSPKMLNIMN